MIQLTSWHKIVTLRADLKSGELSLAAFAADLYDVTLHRRLRRNPLLHQLLQALIELSPTGSEERSLMESISNHVGGKPQTAQRLL